MFIQLISGAVFRRRAIDHRGIKMTHKQTVTIGNNCGLHARVAAMVVQKSTELTGSHRVELEFATTDGRQVPATSMLAILGLNVRPGDNLVIVARGEEAQTATREMADFLASDFSERAQTQVDDLLDEASLTAEQVFNSMATGLVVTDSFDRIVVFNPAAEQIFQVPARFALGVPVSEVWADSMLPVVRSTARPQTRKQVLQKVSLIVTGTPVLMDGQIRGAVAVLENISSVEGLTGELQVVRELKERLQLVLDNVHDGICVVNGVGEITYINPAFEMMMGRKNEEIPGRSVFALSIRNPCALALKSGRKVTNSLIYTPDGVTMVADASPIRVDGEICGVVSVTRDVSEIEHLAERLRRVTARAEYLEDELCRTGELNEAFHDIIGNSAGLRESLAVAHKAAAGTSTVLIRGESGTGKELVARAIHAASPRSHKPFIRVNCAAIPAPLLESELFGHEKGAFTGALQRRCGRFELADGGSIFLDEIGDMETIMQSKLLRVLQEREFERVGGETTIKVDLRIIAATNRNLEEMVQCGRFRDDLYWRLNVVPVFLPPLRERKNDIPFLAEYLLKKLACKLGKNVTGISAQALAFFQSYGWPGNVREMENIVERAVNLVEGDTISEFDLPLHLREPKSPADIFPVTREEPLLPFSVYEKEIISRALKQYGSFRAAARALGLCHKTVAAKARKYGLLP